MSTSTTVVRSTGGGIRLDPERLARRIAAFCDTNNIHNDAQLEAFINGLTTLAQVRAVLREFASALTDFVPP